MPAKIPATVITGFLGAGKTTLIRHMLQNANGRKIALIINEFGDLGVDGDILKGCGIETCSEDDVVELSNGCICCTVADDFIPTMEMLLNRADPPDHIVIETSGLALPQPLVRAFTWPDIRTRVTVDGVVTVVDGPAVRDGVFASNIAAVDAQRAADDNLDHETPLSELFEDQLACADMIVVNKSDLLSRDEAAKLSSDLKGNSRKGVTVLNAEMGAIDPAILLGLGIGAEDDLDARHEVHHHHHHDDDHDDDDHHHDHEHEHGHDEFDSFVVELPELTDPNAAVEKIADVIRQFDVLRLKGFASVTGKPMRLVVQAVGPRVDSYFDRPFAAGEARATRLVVIGQAGLDRAGHRGGAAGMSIAVVPGDSRDPAATALLQASHALMESLFPSESNHYLGVDALLSPEIRFYVAYDGDRMVGTGALAIKDGYGELKSMFVDPDARGTGAGAAIVTQLIVRAKMERLPMLKLETGSLLHAAHRMYERAGFTKCGPFGDYEDGEFSVFMEKAL